MLILRRRAGESFLIGEEVRVTVIATKDKEVQLAIDAPKEVAVLRAELASAMSDKGSNVASATATGTVVTVTGTADATTALTATWTAPVAAK